MKEPHAEKNKSKQGQKRRSAVLLAVNTLLFFSLYRVLLNYAEQTDETFWSFVVMVLYMTLLLGFTLAYLVYNRFLYRKGLTAEDLSPDWTAEQKQAFLADGERRLRRSRWMMLIIFPLLFTFLMDATDLFIIDPIFRR